ncbi:MAG: hypothetical protein KGM43_19935 [Planctomycetota bacterium]|nr:hypothetical protein [Planctomycetota bacterium]
MRRRVILDLDPLETRALLSAASVLGFTAQTPSPNNTAVLERMHTNRAIYQPGQTVQTSFQERNLSAHPIEVVDGGAVSGITVTQDGMPVYSPSATPQSVTITTLKPGHSLVSKSSWNGTINQPGSNALPYGVFQVVDHHAPAGPVATFGISPPITLRIQAAPRQAHIGNVINVTVTETNHGRTSLPVYVADAAATLSVSRHGSTLYSFGTSPGPAGAAQTTLDAGSSRTFNLTWNGEQNQSASTPGSFVQPGVYQINVTVDGLHASTRVREFAAG